MSYEQIPQQPNNYYESLADAQEATVLFKEATKLFDRHAEDVSNIHYDFKGQPEIHQSLTIVGRDGGSYRVTRTVFPSTADPNRPFTAQELADDSSLVAAAIPKVLIATFQPDGAPVAEYSVEPTVMDSAGDYQYGAVYDVNRGLDLADAAHGIGNVHRDTANELAARLGDYALVMPGLQSV